MQQFVHHSKKLFVILQFINVSSYLDDIEMIVNEESEWFVR